MKKESLKKISNLKKEYLAQKISFSLEGQEYQLKVGFQISEEKKEFITLRKNMENLLKLYYPMNTFFQIQAYFMNIIKKI